MKLPNKKFSIIYADPPWNYKDKLKINCGANSKYSVMDINDIKNLDVDSICNDDCILFLWVTFPLINEGLEVIKSWGFTYKTCGFVWIKENQKSPGLSWGMGWWTRANAELCLIGVKGKPKRQSASVHQVIMSKREKHSKKPDEVKEKIVKLCGNIPRIELFARQKTKGWNVWGNEV